MKKTLVIGMVLLMVASACSSDGDDTQPEPTAPNGPSQPGIVSIANTGDPLSVSLSTGRAQTGDEPSPPPVVTGEPLTQADIDAIFDRLPDWIADPDDREDFRRPVDSLTPPRVGETIEGEFPPPVDTDRPEVVVGPLEVLRFQPEGDVPIAPFLSVTFNQPMVPLATVDQLDDFDVPVTITPELPGRWQWIGTRTLRFEHDVDIFDRLPMATEYTIEIPAGTTSEAGGELAESVSWEFATPPVSVRSITPGLSTRRAASLDEFEQIVPPLSLEPVFVVEFDQTVDPAAVVAATEFYAADERTDIRVATAAEIEANEAATQAVDRLLDGRWVAFRPTEPLQPATVLRVEFNPGVPSAEGPLLSTEQKTFHGSTYRPLEVRDISCPSSRKCEPGRDLTAWFNNRIDLDLFDPAMVTVDPAVAGMRVTANGNAVTISGATQAETTYEVTYAATLTDTWGQTLGEAVTEEFKVGSMFPFIQQLNNGIVTLDPLADNPSIGLASAGHESFRVRAFTVTVDQWAPFNTFAERFLYDEDRPSIPSWPVALDTTVDTDADLNTITETAIELGEAIDGEHGHVVVLVEPTGRFADLTPRSNEYWQNRPVLVWAQSTDIGVDIFSDHDSLVTWTTDLRTGEPVADVDISFLTGPVTMTTNADGIGTASLGTVENLVASKGDDVALLPGRRSRQNLVDRTSWYVFDDRQMYRPGETASFKGWVRELTLATEAQLAAVEPGSTVTYTASDPFGNEIGTGELDLTKLGGFDFTLDIPAGANLGQAWIQFELSGGQGSYGHQFQIQEFRRPEFEVSARNESPGPYLASEPATVAVQAEYFSGGPLPNAEVEWHVRTADTSYSPPNWSDYTFGVWVPWWFGGFNRGFGAEAGGFFIDDCFDCFPGADQGEVEILTGVTDANGEHFLQMDFAGDGEGLPTSVTASATVFDVNRQAWASSTALLVHPAEVYVGLRTKAPFVKQGEPLVVDAIAVDIDGEIVVGAPISIEAARLDWEIVNGEWEEIAIDAQTCEVTSTDEPVNCEFTTDIGGRYRVTALVADDAGRTSRSELTRWVSGGNRRPNRQVTQEEITLIPDQETYAPGDTAEILVQAPFSPAEGLVTISRNGFESTESFTVDGDSAVVEVEIRDEYTPNVHVQIDLVGATERIDDRGEPLPDAPPRPAFATGRLDLSIPPVQRTLDVTATPADAATEPGTDTEVQVTVNDAAGNPVADAELAVVVVDEAVLALSGYELADPLDLFYQPIESGVWADYLRRTITLTSPEELFERSREEGSPDTTTAGGRVAAPIAGEAMTDEMAADGSFAPASANFDFGSAGGAQAPNIDVRTNFDALAVFAPNVVTDGDGTATVAVPLPDSLTRYRVMVVAVDGVDRFGAGESNITARLPLQVRPSAPRFLNFGDEFELPVVLQNQTDQAMEVDVAIQTSNLTLTAGEGRRVTVPANDRIEVRFPAEAEDVGTARFRVAAVSGSPADGVADAATISLPVYTPATSEAFATYGVVDGTTAVGQTIVAPEDVFPQFGGLEINTSSTALQSLTDAVLYLHDYRYSNSDGLAARILAISALRDVLDAFDAQGLPAPAELERRVEADIEALLQLQTNNGGFAVWATIRGSSPYHSVYATHALVEARDNGYAVNEQKLASALQHLASIEDFYPNEYYTDEIRPVLSAYALHVRALAGDRDVGKATGLYQRSADDIGLEGLAWLWPVIDDAGIRSEIEREFQNRATETAGAATFATNYGEDAYLILHSSRRTDGVILDALISEAPASDLIPKVVAGLMGGQTRGRWNNAQENSFILLALNNYFDTFEGVDPDFVARVWLGDLYAAEHTYEGRSTDRNLTLVPMDELLEQTGTGGADDDDRTDLIVSKDGEGRLYYRLGLRYAPTSLDLDPLDRGFVVERTYEAVDNPDDVTRDADGTWRVKAGAEVRVRLTMVADARRTHVALIDPLPAGFEALNPALAVTGPIPPDEGNGDAVSPGFGRGGWWSWWRWYEHTNLRDDRAEAFAGILWGGTYDYTYVARATTPGDFVVPPARAEEIYAPETFGRSASERVVIEG